MRYLLTIIFIIAECVNYVSAEKQNTFHQTHSLDYVLKIHMSYPDSALHILQGMEDKNIEPIYLVNAQRALVYSGQKKHHLSLNFAHKALKSDSLKAHPKYYMQTVSICQVAHQNLNEYKECLQILWEGLEFARKHKIKVAEISFTFTAGKIYYLLNNKKEAHQYFAQAIQLGEDESSYKVKPMLSYCYGEMCSILAEEGKYQEALELSKRREQVIQQMTSFKNVPIGYIDQQFAYLYSKEAFFYSKLNQKKKADNSYKKFKQTHCGQTIEGQASIINYWMDNHQYDAVIDYYLQQPTPADTLNENYIIRLKNISEAYHGKKLFKQAYDYQQRLTVIKDSLTKKIQKEQMAELATIYQLKEKEIKITQQQEEMEKLIIIRNLLAGGFFLVCLLLWMAWHHIRTMQKKNLLMANSINAVLNCEQKIETLEKEIFNAQPKVEPTEPSDTDLYLFKRMERMIKDEKLYLNADLSRQVILDRLSIDKNRFSKIMQEYLQMTLPQYLNNLRVKHAITQLKEHSNYSMQAVAEESGFNNLRNFQRIFKITTGMTPTEYKNAVLTKA